MIGPRALGLIVTLGGASVASAGGWVQPVGAWYAKIDNRLLSAERGYRADGSGAQDTGGRYAQWALSLYGEWGLTPTLTAVVAATPVGWAAFDDRDSAARGDRINRSTTWIGPIGGGLRWGALRGPVHLAFEGRYGWAPPVGDSVVGAGSFTCDAQPCDRFVWQPTVASHRFDGEAQIGVGLPAGLWLSGALGGRLFVGVDQDPVLRATGQLGWSVSDWLRVEGHVDAWQPTGEVTVDALAGSGQTRFVAVGGSLSVALTDQIALRLARDGAVGVRANAAAPVYGVGVELHSGD